MKMTRHRNRPPGEIIRLPNGSATQSADRHFLPVIPCVDLFAHWSCHHLISWSSASLSILLALLQLFVKQCSVYWVTTVTTTVIKLIIVGKRCFVNRCVDIIMFPFLQTYKYGELSEACCMVEFGNKPCEIFSKQHLLDAKGGPLPVFLGGSHMVHLGSYVKQVHSNCIRQCHNASQFLGVGGTTWFKYLYHLEGKQLTAPQKYLGNQWRKYLDSNKESRYAVLSPGSNDIIFFQHSITSKLNRLLKSAGPHLSNHDCLNLLDLIWSTTKVSCGRNTMTSLHRFIMSWMSWWLSSRVVSFCT